MSAPSLLAPPSSASSAAPGDEAPSARTGVRMTAAEFLRLPDDPTLDRWLIAGEVWEEPMTVRSVPHSTCEAYAAAELRFWLKADLPDWRVSSGESGVLLPGRETALGVDVVVFDAETVAAQPPPPRRGEGIHLWHGVPRLAVEIASASDREENVTAKIAEYLAAGVAQVWEVRPALRTVTVHRSDADPAIFRGDAVISGGSALPGLSVRAGDLFPD